MEVIGESNSIVSIPPTDGEPKVFDIMTCDDDDEALPLFTYHPSQNSCNNGGLALNTGAVPWYVVVITIPLDNVFVPFPVWALGNPSG
jgi:hypothetical protein